jgi:hypothetical protein
MPVKPSSACQAKPRPASYSKLACQAKQRPAIAMDENKDVCDVAKFSAFILISFSKLLLQKNFQY